jgi:uncharacterized protein (DUF2147 family)
MIAMRWLALALLLLAAPAAAAEPVSGVWRTEAKDALVRIADCGAGLCGRVTRFLVPPPQGNDQRDVNNPDPKLRTRKLLGLAVLRGFREDDGRWRGEIYDPKSGKSYRSLMRRLDSERLEVKGCIGPFCKTQIWRKVG